jgi:hypothetical protein
MVFGYASHLDASDVWEAIDRMNKWKVPQGFKKNARRQRAAYTA